MLALTAVPASLSDAPLTTVNKPARSARQTPTDPSGSRQVVPISLGPFVLGLLQAIATLSRQLFDGHHGPTKLTSFYAVLQAATDVGQELPKSIIIDCYGAKRTVEEKDMIMAECGLQ